MCRFKINIYEYKLNFFRFQYIVCVGSRILRHHYLFQTAPFQYIVCVGSSNLQFLQNVLLDGFQYIVCVGSRIKNNYFFFATKKFQYIVCVGSSFSFFIRERICLISIHRMCRFKISGIILSLSFLVFQYIVCVGSSKTIIFKFWELTYFNTSYVSVQEFNPSILWLLDWISIHRMCRFKLQPLYLIKGNNQISIHRMCRFKGRGGRTSIYFKEFQYIVCVGSSTIKKPFSSLLLWFQ